MIGREFGLDQLARLVDDLSEDALLEVLDEALAAVSSRSCPGDAGRYQFTHALIQATLADELSLTRRARLHARIAEALEELYGAEAEQPRRRARPSLRGGRVVLGPDKLVRYSLLAGESALAAHAPEQALAHFERALAAKGDEAMADDRLPSCCSASAARSWRRSAPYELEPAIASLRAPSTTTSSR